VISDIVALGIDTVMINSWRSRVGVVVLCIVGCQPFVDDVARPTLEPTCVDTLERVQRCEPSFPDRTALCRYSESDCPPYINPEQQRCLRELPCESIRAAVRDGWLCGISMVRPPP
jgi:hypothetical protein